MRSESRAASLVAIIGVLSSAATISCAGLRGTAAGGGPTTQSKPSGAGPGPAEAVGSAAFGSLAVRKWRLPNGLEIITVPDLGARSVSYVTAFRVGSRDEDAAAGEAGLAHLFEHLMFTGTPGGAVGRGDFDRQLEEVGGSSNATTSSDVTLYTDEIPAEALGRAIRLEADRMMNLNLEPRRVANERDVVVEERLASVEDSVDGVLEEIVYQQAFRAHPYRRPVIGRMEDIRSITPERAVAFYRRHYAPERAVVIVAGRFDEPAALDAIAAAYGALASAAARAPAPVIAPERAPAVEVRSDISRPVSADRILIGYPAPALGDEDRAAYELLATLLAGGPSSRLYRLLVVDREIASSVNEEVAPTRDPGLWSLWIQMTKGHDAGQAETLVLREIERLIAEPTSASELNAAKNRMETEFWQELGPSRGRAEALGQFEVVTGDFRNLISRGSSYARVSGADVARVARAYLGGGARSVAIAHPQDGP